MNREQKASGTKDLTIGAPLPTIITFALSMIATSVMSYVYNITDSIMVSRFVDVHAMGAISAISPMYSLINALISSTIGGFAICVGREFGAGKIKNLQKFMANSVLLSVILVIPISLLSVIFAGQFCNLMNVPAAFRANAIIYLAITIGASPICAISWLCSGMFRALGDSKSSLYRSALSGALNVFFNFIFLAVIPLGVAGAALGTVCSSVVNAAMCLWQLKYRMPLLHFWKTNLKLSKPITKTLLSNAIPLGLLSSIVQIGSMILQIAVNSHSEAMITGISIGDKLLAIVWIIIIGFEDALLYFCSQNYGAKKFDRIKKGYRDTFILVFIIAGVCTVLSIFFGEYFYRLFLGFENNAETLNILKYSKLYIFTQTVFFPFMLCLSIPRGTLKGMGKTIPAVMCGVMELIGCITVTALSFFAPLSENAALNILFFARPAAWVGAGIFLLISILIAFRKMKSISELADEQQPS